MRALIQERVLEALAARMPVELGVSMLLGPYYASAGLGYEWDGSAEAGPDFVSARVRSRLTDAWLILRLPVAGGDARKIAGLPQMTLVDPSSSPEPRQAMPDAMLQERLAQLVAYLEKEDVFSGVVLVARDGASLFERAVGYASKAYGIPNQLDTRFNVASVGKLFTAVAVAQLVDQGRLSFEDPIGKVIPEGWIAADSGDKIQIRHLLSHTSGLGNYFGRLYGQSAPMFFRELEDYQALIASEAPTFEPGTSWAYSSSGMMLAGLAVQTASGEPYPDFVQKHIFEEAGMTRSGLFDKDGVVPDRASPLALDYAARPPAWRENAFTRVMKGVPSGGAYVTAADLLRFDQALRGARLLRPETTELLWTPKPEIGAPYSGYGFFLFDGPAGRVAWHAGDGTGVHCQFRMYLEAGYTVVILSNYGPPAAGIVEQAVSQLLGG